MDRMTTSTAGFESRLITNWVYGGALAGVLLLLLSPLLISTWPPALAVTFLCLPAYMLHQYEEHDDDRFRTFFNATVGKGKEVLTPKAVFIANVPGVWGIISISLYLAAGRNIGFSLIAVYLLLLNAAVHLVSAVMVRGYNPGLGSGVLLFIPLGVFGLWQVQAAGGGTPAFHAIGFLVALGIHAAIMAQVFRKRSRRA